MRPLIRLFPRTAIVVSVAILGIFLSAFLLTGQSFRITGVQATNNNVRITWNAPGGSNYVLQSATNLWATNFTDLSPALFVPGVTVTSTNYTHSNAVPGSKSRFYRVRSSPAATLKIYPSNAVIGVTTTNRYKVYLVYPDSSTQDVTSNSTLTVSNKIGQYLGVSTNGYAQVLGTNAGVGSVRAVYQNMTNTATLTVGQLTGIYTVPTLSQVNGYVNGASTLVQVMGIFSTGKTNNITPSSTLDGGAVSSTRIDYNVSADVANSYALITGQSAANGNIDFTAGGTNTPDILVTWCKYDSVFLLPASPTVNVGGLVQVSAYGHVADGSIKPLALFEIDTFSSSDDTIASWSNDTFQVYGISPGTVSIGIAVNDGAGCTDPTYFTNLAVIDPPVITSQPFDQVVTTGSNAVFTAGLSGASPMAFRWQLAGTNLPNATNNPLVVSNVTAASQGNYQLIATNIYGSVTSSVAALTVAPTASISWINRYAGPGNFDVATSLAIDTNGNVVVTGNSEDAGGINHFATVKYSTAGAPLWTNRFNGPANSHDLASALSVDTSGNVIVAGQATALNGKYDYATVKYSNSGVPLWTNFYNGPVSDSDGAYAVTVDTNGNVFVTGHSLNTSSNDDYVTIKYSSAGVPQWTNRYNSPANDYDSAQSIALDGSGNVFVTGISTGTSANDDYATIKYSNAGVPIWTNRFNGSANGNDQPRRLVVDTGGNAIVTGYTTRNDGTLDFAIIKYSGAGVPLWTNFYNGPGNGADTASAVAVDSSGNVFVTGASIGPSGLRDYATIKYSSAGAPLWTNRYNSPLNDADQPTGIAVDGTGNVFVTGYSWNGADFDYLTLKYSNAGVLQWLSRYNGPGNDWDIVTGIATDNSGHVVITGYSPNASGFLNYTTIKY